MIKTVVIDDQPACIDSLVMDLSVDPELQVVNTFSVPDEAIAFIRYNQPDLLFLDMEMPQKNGLEVLQEISEYITTDMVVVFYSAYDKYMLDAIRQSAFDFLLKPYKKEELELVIRRVKEKLQVGATKTTQSIQQLQVLNSKKFAIRTPDQIVMVDYSEVLYFEFQRDARCWQVMLTNNAMYDLRPTTTKNEILAISSSFVQVSKKNIINLNYLFSIEKKNKLCTFYPPFNKINHIYLSSAFYTNFKDDFEVL